MSEFVVFKSWLSEYLFDPEFYICGQTLLFEHLILFTLYLIYFLILMLCQGPYIACRTCFTITCFGDPSYFIDESIIRFIFSLLFYKVWKVLHKKNNFYTQTDSEHTWWAWYWVDFQIPMMFIMIWCILSMIPTLLS